MKGYALASVMLLLSCGGDKLHTSQGDASREEAGVLDGWTEVSPAPGAPDSDVASDGGGVSPGTSFAPCANGGVPPYSLACTGLYADIATKTVASGVRFYQPAVPLWSDNSQKTRWIQIPPGTQIDASNPSEWAFPVGTKVWKEFSRNGKRIETRLFQKVDNGPPPIWHHTTYAWTADESAAFSSGGGDIQLDSDGGTYHIPIPAECDKCHNGRTDHLLGFEQVSLGLQGAQGLTLPELAKEGLIAPVPTMLQSTIGDDGTGAAAPALAWIHINCGVTCHNANSNATAYGVKMHLRLDPMLLDGRPVTVSDFDTLKTTIGALATSPAWVSPVHWTRIVPGDPSKSLLVQLISNRGKNNPAKGQMPPIASSVVDTVDVAKVVDWVSKMSAAQAIDGGLDAGAEATVATNQDAQPDVTTGDAAGDAPTDAAPHGQ
jgi:hypothetical protein